MKKIISITLLILLLCTEQNSLSESRMRYYSLNNQMPYTADKTTFYFAYPYFPKYVYGDTAHTETYSATIGPLGSKVTNGWRWEAVQSSNYSSWPYKIEVTWTENGVKKSKTTCVVEKWAEDSHWTIEPDGSVPGKKGIEVDPRPAIQMGPTHGCDTSLSDDYYNWSPNCCRFDGISYWPDPV